MVENEFENLRKKWYDKKEEEWSTEVLFIAESPPAYSSLENYFYYTGDDADQRNLFGSLLSPLGIENDDFDSKSGRLKEFLKKYWLEDLFYDPIDDVDETDVGDHVKKLKKEIERINPDRILIMLPNKAEEKIESVIEYLDENIGGENINETLNNGDLIEKELEPNEVLKVSTGHVAAFEPSVYYDVQRTGGIKSSLFSGEGLFMTTLQGPGKVWLQSMTLPDLGAALSPHVSGGNGGSSGSNGPSISFG